MLDPKRIWTSSQLPTLPTVAVKLLEMSRDPETEVRDVINAIKSDPALTAKIIKAANSSYFGVRTEVKSVDRAVPLLGTTVTTSLALSFSVNDAAMTPGPLAKHYQAYWKQSVVQACAAETFSQKLAPKLSAENFLCGLLQDIGRLAMLKTIPQEYLPVLESAEQNEMPLCQGEAAGLGMDHAEIGAKLMEHWNLPAALVQSVRLHHAAVETVLAERGSAEFPLLAATAVSGAVGDYFCSPCKGLAFDRLRQLTEQICEFSPKQMDEFLRECTGRIEQAAGLFNLDVGDLGDPSDLMVQANEQLAQIAWREAQASAEAAQRQQEAEKQRAELENRNRDLQHRALHDRLTGVYNRHFFDETMSREVGRCQRMAVPMGLLFADIDRFKSINDTYSHQFGDEVLQQVAQTFKAVVRTSDVLARYGGEEFVVLVSQPTERGVQRLAERIRQAVEALVLHHADQQVKVTCSLGAALAIPHRHDKDIGQRLIAAADACLYEAKHGGRNQVKYRSLVEEEDRVLMQRMTEHRFSRWLVRNGLLDVPTISRALVLLPEPQKLLGDLAVESRSLTPEQVRQVLSEQESSGERFGAIAMRLEFLTQQQLVHLLALQQENPKVLAKLIIQQGLLPPERTLAALEQYLKEKAPARAEVQCA